MGTSSTKAKAKWLEENYKRIQVRIEKDLVEEFDQATAARFICIIKMCLS